MHRPRWKERAERGANKGCVVGEHSLKDTNEKKGEKTTRAQPAIGLVGHSLEEEQQDNRRQAIRPELMHGFRNSTPRYGRSRLGNFTIFGEPPFYRGERSE